MATSVSVELRDTYNNKFVPLQGLNVNVTVEQYVAQVEVVASFYNQEPNPIETVYV
jgi:hypothetical protein